MTRANVAAALAARTGGLWFADYGKLGADEDGIGEMDSTADGDAVALAVNLADPLWRVAEAAREALAWLSDECIPDGAEYAAEAHLGSMNGDEFARGGVVRDALRAALADLDAAVKEMP